MAKSWIELDDRSSLVYMSGVNAFLEFAFAEKVDGAKIYCPCSKCHNRLTKTKHEVKLDCLRYGFLKTYKNWRFHGEPFESSLSEVNVVGFDLGNDMEDMIREGMGYPGSEPFGNEHTNGPDNDAKKFYKLMEEAQVELYPGCKNFSKLSFIVRVLQEKVLNGWTDKSVDALFSIFRMALPEGSKVPKSYYEAKKITEDLGFTSQKIDSCRNNCMLFRGEDSSRETCEICGESRYKDNVKKISAKQMRYFPLKPRLQKLFMCSKTASLMRWHGEERRDDGVLRHPADSPCWKDFDNKHPEFASDVRNVRIGLASDGFNPYRNMNLSHSTWPVVIMIYNLPPWLCMKQSYLLLSTLVDGPKGPGNKIDVYMQPLIDELKELWSDGVVTFDASVNEMFTLRAALLWTVSDFPAYAMLSGKSTKGELACPHCAKNTRSQWLKYGRKFCYTCHRRFLPIGNKLRRDKLSFNGKMELEGKPPMLSGIDVLEELILDNVLTEYKKEDIKRRLEERVDKSKKNYKKLSIFYELDYWKTNLIRHCLDVMHIEKNVCENVIWTLLAIAKRSKDNFNSRLDLKHMGIRTPLHPKKNSRGKFILPPGSYTLDKAGKALFCKVLKNLKAPDGYGSNISRCVHENEKSLLGLKSHDMHILMQQILPVAVRKILPPNVVRVLIELSNFFKQLCSKVNTISDLEKIQERIVLTICHLEKIFPPSFFDIMEHLPIHLASEALVAGAVQFRWMYPIERYLLTLKKYVRNRAHPEGSIEKGYLMEECMNFCSRYMNDVETKENRKPRNPEGDGKASQCLGKGRQEVMERITLAQAHKYVLANSDVVAPFREIHLQELSNARPRGPRRDIDRLHSGTFHQWFKSYVNGEQGASSCTNYSEEINLLAGGPTPYGIHHKSCISNGFRFRTKGFDESKATQNSGVVVRAVTNSYSSAKDRNPRSGAVNYHGVLTDILELKYSNDLKFLMFKCDWVDINKGSMVDDFGFTLVNFNHLLYRDNLETSEPFVLATQAEQVWYLEDPSTPDWKVVMPMLRRDHYDVYSVEVEDELYSRQQLDDPIPLRDEDVGWVRQDLDGIEVSDREVDDQMRESDDEE